MSKGSWELMMLGPCAANYGSEPIERLRPLVFDKPTCGVILPV